MRENKELETKLFVPATRLQDQRVQTRKYVLDSSPSNEVSELMMP